MTNTAGYNLVHS